MHCCTIRLIGYSGYTTTQAILDEYHNGKVLIHGMAKKMSFDVLFYGRVKTMPGQMTSTSVVSFVHLLQMTYWSGNATSDDGCIRKFSQITQ